MLKVKKIKEYWIHIIAWICIFSFPLSISYLDLGEVQFGMFYRMLLNLGLLYLNYLVLVPILLLRKKTLLYVISSILVLILFNLVANSMMPFAPPIERFRSVLEKGDMVRLRKMPHFFSSIMSLTFFMLGAVLGLAKDYYKRDKINRQIKVQSKETELQFLKAQLNPHFLFNSLNSIYSLVRNGSNEAPEAVITLSELMRYMLYEAQEDLVPLAKEIEYIKNYVHLQLYRLSNSENVKLKISGEYSDKKISPLLLIPFVENAFKYGTDFKGKTYVDIKIQIFDDSLFFQVINGIGAYQKDELSSGIGLTNIQNRLDLLYPNDHLLKIDKKNGFHSVQLELNLTA
ncbi:sensor histidine kinase [Allomuricauda sp. SCSIO 65647]|uniref:sensor histidine kinase n=1 Tax=Allomuricauda sp. SCSIO 65647 TaxID=2908843 RepID=UPI001F21221D|nr:histidine kinase [Muricauda sp. SCSIO 65647]UJH69147.1 histidine kinase [Muricauda sp. SCSIO 65647]